METEMGKMKCGLSKSIRECQENAYVMTSTLPNDIQDRLKETKDTLVTITQKLKDQDNTITLLKQALANGRSFVVMSMRNKIKEPNPYDDTHNANLLGH